jgi:DNA-binding response OmpR family regulator
MLDRRMILVVEDSPLLAMQIVEIVIELDGEVIGPFDTVAEALRMLDLRSVSGALLDALLLDRDITPVALHLASAGVPVVIYSGTGLPHEVALSRPDLPVVMKPLPPRVAIERLCAEMRKSGHLPV